MILALFVRTVGCLRDNIPLMPRYAKDKFLVFQGPLRGSYASGIVVVAARNREEAALTVMSWISSMHNHEPDYSLLHGSSPYQADPPDKHEFTVVRSACFTGSRPKVLTYHWAAE